VRVSKEAVEFGLDARGAEERLFGVEVVRRCNCHRCSIVGGSSVPVGCVCEPAGVGDRELIGGEVDAKGDIWDGFEQALAQDYVEGEIIEDVEA